MRGKGVIVIGWGVEGLSASFRNRGFSKVSRYCKAFDYFKDDHGSEVDR